jgi:hypothetical protein
MIFFLPCIFTKDHLCNLYTHAVQDLTVNPRECDLVTLPSFEDEEALWLAYYHILLAVERCSKYLAPNKEKPMHLQMAQVRHTAPKRSGLN